MQTLIEFNYTYRLLGLLNCEHVVFVSFLKQKLKKVRGLYEQILWILKIYWKSNFVRGFHEKKFQNCSKILQKFEQNFGVTRDPSKNLGPIGSAVLTFIGYKQTDKPNLYIT